MGLSPQESTQRQRDPSTFLMKNTGAPPEEELALMNSLAKITSMYPLSARGLSVDNLQRGPNGASRAPPGTKLILWSSSP